jgi:hypothetical protein
MYFTDITLNVQATVAHHLPSFYDKETKFLGTDDVFIYVRTYVTHALQSLLYKRMGEKRG